VHVAERKRNPFIRSPGGGRILSAVMLPWFLLRPPDGFGVLITTGRRTGKTRRKCIRAIRTGNQAYIVSIGGARAAWLKNIRADPNVRLRISGGTLAGIARELPPGTSETEAAMLAYCETVRPFDYDECRIHRPGRPTASKIKELHRSWFTKGIPVAIQLHE
jgi:deazaflavin-dependent oxidoreductase (nitroreductase family)